MTEENLIICTGLALWGERYQAPMASAISVSRDSVQDWRQKRTNPRRGVYVDLLRVAEERRAEIDAVIEKLKQYLEDRRGD